MPHPRAAHRYCGGNVVTTVDRVEDVSVMVLLVAVMVDVIVVRTVSVNVDVVAEVAVVGSTVGCVVAGHPVPSICASVRRLSHRRI